MNEFFLAPDGSNAQRVRQLLYRAVDEIVDRAASGLVNAPISPVPDAAALGQIEEDGCPDEMLFPTVRILSERLSQPL